MHVMRRFIYVFTDKKSLKKPKR